VIPREIRELDTIGHRIDGTDDRQMADHAFLVDEKDALLLGVMAW